MHVTGKRNTISLLYTTSLHEDPTFSIHSLNPHRKFVFTWLPWLYYAMRRRASAQGVRVNFIMFAGTSYSASTLLLRIYIGQPCICVWGGTAKGH